MLNTLANSKGHTKFQDLFISQTNLFLFWILKIKIVRALKGRAL